jgi:glycosyltransferase involved in cell wall biosynthesis
MTRIGVYTGTIDDDSENVVAEFTSWGRYLQGYELEAFGGATLPPEAQEYYRKVETDSRATGNPYQKMRQAYRDCREYVERRSPDLLVQLWRYRTHGVGVVAAARRSGIPAMTRFVGDHFNEHDQFDGLRGLGVYSLSLVGRAPLHLSDRVFVFGPYGRSEIVSRGAALDDVVLHPPPGDTGERFRPSADRAALRRSLKLPQDRQIVLYVGRLRKLKGMDFLAEVARRVTDQSDVLFVVIGTGPYGEILESDFRSDDVRVEGYVPHEEIHEYYQAADLYVHPSPHEGLPLVVLEALNCGTPVVAREAGDIGFVTPNVVTEPGEMVEMIVDQTWNDVFLNYRYFTECYQRKALRTAVEELTS